MKFLFIFLSVSLIGIIRADSQNTAQKDSTQKLKSVLDSPVDFSGWKGKYRTINNITEFRIGLFLPSDSLNGSDQSLLNAANMAIDEINSTGGYTGIPIKLIKRWSTDPWGSGSKKMIKLVYDDSVLAVVGSINGDATHVAEQICTKARLPLLSPISADPTLTYIRIPWIFRLPPDYGEQANVIVNKGIIYNRMKNIGIITEYNHDGRIFGKELSEVLGKNRISPLFHFEVSKSDLDFSSIVQRAISFNPQSIIICLSKENIIKLLSELTKNSKNIDVLMPWIPEIDDDTWIEYNKGKVYYLEPFVRSSNQLYEKFADRYRKSYESNPTFGAAYTYDSLYLLFHALKTSGPNRTILRDAMAGMNGYEGVTGKIIWDNGGGNVARPVMKVLKNIKVNQE